MTSLDFPHTGVGWTFPVRWDRTAGDQIHAATDAGVEKVRQAMTLIVLTDLGERRMRPLFGSDASGFVFESMNGPALVQLADRIERALKLFEPRVLIDLVEAVPAPDDGRVDIVVEFRMDRHRRPESLIVPFYPQPGAGS